MRPDPESVDQLSTEEKPFDPENVKRTVGECDFGEGWYDYDVVEAEDYDKLLALYRELLIQKAVVN